MEFLIADYVYGRGTGGGGSGGGVESRKQSLRIRTFLNLGSLYNSVIAH